MRGLREGDMSTRMRKFLAVVLTLLVPGAVYAAGAVEDVEWPSYGGDLASTKYSQLAQIDGENFSDLRVAWSWRSPDTVTVIENSANRLFRRTRFEATPLMVGGTLYISTGLGRIASIDAATGRTRWVFDPKSYIGGGPANYMGFLTRGVAYWSDGNDERILSGTHDGYLIALDAKTGKLVPDFGVGGKVDLMPAVPRVSRSSGMTLAGGETFHLSVDSPPTICRDVVVVGSSLSDRPPTKEWPPGYVQAFDVRTGAPRWVFHTIPQNEEFGVETWENESWRYSGNANVWTMMSADDDLGYVYLPTSTPTSDYYGAFRLGDNLFAESLVCVNVETGERVWHFQMVHHGLWDWDLPAAPNLLDIPMDGKIVKAVAQVSKQGWCYVFDRVTGKPLWPIEERAVPPSDVPGEVASLTQPFPTKPPPFDFQGLNIEDLIDFTPELRAEAVEEMKNYRIGPIFTPPSLYVEGGTRGTPQLPGAGGGANWSGAAVDPETAMLYVPSRTRMSMVILAEVDPEVSNLRYVRSGTVGPRSFHPARPTLPRGPQGLPIIKPPYSRMTAYDLTKGEIAWMVPTGQGRDEVRNHPALEGLDLPALGGQGRGGPLLTKTLLIQALSAGGGKGPRLAAYDKKTGEKVAEVELPGEVTGTPMTYLIDGRQYISFPARHEGPRVTLVALALP